MGVCQSSHTVDNRIQTTVIDSGGSFYDKIKKESVNKAVAKSPDLFYDSDFEQLLTLQDEEIVLKRPYEIVEEGQTAQFLIDGLSSSDVVQGSLGDCWFLSSCAAISRHPELLSRVIPKKQSLQGEDYVGFLCFKFWKFGKWTEVIIDDLLVTKYNQLYYARCNDRNEFWLPLMEKAYAKLNNGYENLEGGFSKDALVDLTGGVSEKYNVKDMDEKTLFDNLLRAYKTGAFITASRKLEDINNNNNKKDVVSNTKTNKTKLKGEINGLIANHAYTVMRVEKDVETTRKKNVVNLILIRNPWGKKEWTGEWSDGCASWDLLNEKWKKKLRVKNQDDGEFWMNVCDFSRHFTEITVCTLQPDEETTTTTSKRFSYKTNKNNDDDDNNNNDYNYYKENTIFRSLFGQWIENETAGGCINYDTYHTNPQFLLEVVKSTSNFLISLMQEDDYHGRQREQIGFAIYKTPEDNEQQQQQQRRLDAEFFKYNREVTDTGSFINWREVTKRIDLDVGFYVIIPSTFVYNRPKRFLIRVFSRNDFQLLLL